MFFCNHKMSRIFIICIKKYHSLVDTLYSHLQLPFDVDPWKMVETHVLSDYMNHEVIKLWYSAAY